MAESSGRRGVLKVLVGVGGLAIGALVGLPGVSYLLDPLLRRRSRASDFVEVGEASALRDDRPVALTVIGEVRDAWTRAPNQRLGTVWIQKKDDGLLALSAECPHLGCRIGYAPDRDAFTCPCHESLFGLDGSTQAGPSPRAMDTLEAHVSAEGKVLVKFKRFRTSMEDQVEVG
jgi:Rieske Fe-S protein